MEWLDAGLLLWLWLCFELESWENTVRVSMSVRLDATEDAMDVRE